MGRALIELAAQQQLVVHGSLAEAAVVIDFSSPQGLLDIIQQAQAAQIPLVSGTTGLTDTHRDHLDAASKTIPVLWSANMSIGVNLLYRLAEQASRLIGNLADCEILEAHHRHKKDAPSGTALELGRRIATAQGNDFNAVARLSRSGMNCEREPGEIGFSTVRAGNITGEHTALFALAGERLELTHRADDRRIFAGGALRVAQWLACQPVGLYSFQDMLNNS